MDTRQSDAIAARRLIEGPHTKLMQVRPVRHVWARDLLKVMMNNTWSHNEVDMSEDAKQFATGVLADSEKSAAKKALAFLSNLDGIQLNNLVNNINQHVTSPEVNQCLVRQAWEEALHVESYAKIVESLDLDPVEVYWMFEDDEMLAQKNANIIRQSELLGEGYSAENFARAIVANVALEGVYFYNGFLTFYSLARMGKLKNSAKMIKFIQRDEITHLKLFLEMWKTLRQERPELFNAALETAARDIMRQAAEMEAAWGRYIIRDGVLGLNDKVVTEFVQYLADLRMTQLGLPVIYGTKNPCPWFDEFSKVNDTETNFFENKVANYKAGGFVW